MIDKSALRWMYESIPVDIWIAIGPNPCSNPIGIGDYWDTRTLGQVQRIVLEFKCAMDKIFFDENVFPDNLKQIWGFILEQLDGMYIAKTRASIYALNSDISLETFKGKLTTPFPLYDDTIGERFLALKDKAALELSSYISSSYIDNHIDLGVSMVDVYIMTFFYFAYFYPNFNRFATKTKKNGHNMYDLENNIEECFSFIFNNEVELPRANKITRNFIGSIFNNEVELSKYNFSKNTYAHFLHEIAKAKKEIYSCCIGESDINEELETSIEMIGYILEQMKNRIHFKAFEIKHIYVLLVLSLTGAFINTFFDNAGFLDIRNKINKTLSDVYGI